MDLCSGRAVSGAPLIHPSRFRLVLTQNATSLKPAPAIARCVDARIPRRCGATCASRAFSLGANGKVGAASPKSSAPLDGLVRPLNVTTMATRIPSTMPWSEMVCAARMAFSS
jgi:hypothetical protein